jgi:hypothetical protein
VHEPDGVSDAEPVDELLRRSAGLGPGDEVQLDLALGAQLGDGLQKRRDPLHRGVGAGHRDDPAGHPRRVVRPERRVDAEGDDLDPTRLDAEVGRDVARRARRDGEDARHRAGDLALHAQEPVPAAEREATTPGRRGGEVDPPVEGDGVVDGRDQRYPGALEGKHPVAQCLVVVHDVEVSSSRSFSSRATRRLNVRGSGKPAVHMVATSSRSMASRYSPGRGVRNGSGSRYRSRLGTLVSRTPGSSSG